MPTAPRIGSFAAAMMLLKSYLGSGLLAVPYAFDCGGMEASIIGIFLLAAISTHRPLGNACLWRRAASYLPPL